MLLVIAWLLPNSRDDVSTAHEQANVPEQLSVDALIDKGYEAMGQATESAYNDAYGFFSRAQTQNSHSLHARFGVAWARNARGAPASDWYDLYVETANDALMLASYSLVNMARSKNNDGEQDAAIALYTRAANIEHDKSVGWIRLGDALLRMARYQAAISPLKRATEIEPNNAKALYSYGAALGHSGNTEAAAAQLNKAAEFDSTLRGDIAALKKKWSAASN